MKIFYSFWFLDFRSLIYKGMLTGLFILLAGTDLQAQQEKIDSLYKMIRNCQADTCRIRNQTILSEIILFNTDDIDTGRALSYEALKLIEKNVTGAGKELMYFLKMQKANAFNNIGYAFSREEKFDIVLDYYRKSLAIREEIGFKKGIAGSLNNIASTYRYKGDFANSLDYVYKALKINEEIGNVNWMARNHSIIGGLNLDMGRYDDALSSYRMALLLFDSLGERKSVGSALINVGSCYEAKKQYDQAMLYFDSALALPQTRDRDRFVAMNGKGNILLLRNKDQEALEIFKEALVIINRIPDKDGYEMVQINIGNIFLKNKQFDEAGKSFLSGLTYCRDKGNRVGAKDCLSSLHRCAYEKGDFSGAYQYLYQYTQLKDSLLNSENNKVINEISIRYETQKKDQEIALLAKERDLQDYRLERQHQQLMVNQSESQRKETQMMLMDRERSIALLNAQHQQAELENQQLANEKVKTELTSLTNQKLLQEATLSREKIYRNGAILFSGFLLIIGALLYSRARTNKKNSQALQEKNRIIQQENERAIKSEQFKTEFLATMSHEIRTPLHAITGMINVLSQRNPREDQSPYLNVMRKSSENLIGIVNNVLDLSKIEAGKIEFEKSLFSPAETVESVVSLLQAHATDKGLELKASYNNLPQRVIGDQVRLNQVLVNLLGNAIKFTESGSVTITAERKPGTVGDKGNCVLFFSVADTGPGIAPENLTKIFESFTQAEEGITRRFGGTGLGLTISRQLVHLQGGSIEVNSKPGSGSVFSFSIPFSLPAIETPATIPVVGAKATDLNGSRILIVEDNSYNQLVAIETLNILFKNLIIDTAENGFIALEKIARNTYDFVLMDLQMPEMDGYSTMRKIRETMPEKLNESVYIAISANTTSGEKEKCREAGLYEYLSKPFKQDDLARLMRAAKKV